MKAGSTWSAWLFSSTPNAGSSSRDKRKGKRQSDRRKEAASRKKKRSKKGRSSPYALLFFFVSALALAYVVDVQGVIGSYRGKQPAPSPKIETPKRSEKIIEQPAAVVAPVTVKAESAPPRPQLSETGTGSLHAHDSESPPAAEEESIPQDQPPAKKSHEHESSEHVPEGSQGSASADGSGRSGGPVVKKVPMNREMAEIQVPGEVGSLSDEAVKSYYRKLAKAYLSTFTQGIYRHMFFDVLRRRTYSLTPPGANKGVQSMMFQVIDHKVYMMDPYEVPKNSKPFYRTRINEIIWLLSKLAKERRLKNTEFMVSIHDCVQTVNAPHTYRGATYQESIPSFTIVSCNFSDNIPFPMWEGDATRGGGFQSWDKRMQDYGTASQQAWTEKEDKAVFRGGNRPSMFFQNKTDANKNCDEVGRTRIAFLASQHPNSIDASIGGSCGGVHRYLQRMDEVKQQKYKYVVYAEGNCFWADRLNKQVFGPSMILKQETPCGQFWEPLLKPMTHYLPVDFFFNNLVDQVQWARDNDAQAQQIIRNANEFASNFLTLRSIENYVEVLLSEYTSLLVEPDVKLEPGAIEVTDKMV